MQHLDLFSGIGGFALAAKWAGFNTIQFVEKDKFCQKVLAKNFPNVPIHDDIKTFNFTGKVKLMTGGFPCQPFSVAGQKKGINDDRYLWPEMLRIIKQCEPSWIIAENVTGIIHIAIDEILMDLERENYHTETYIIPASAVQAPHRRDRIWIVANCINKRCDNGISNWQKRFIQANIDRNMAQIQPEWEEFKPESWTTFNVQNWLTDNYSQSSQQTNSSSQPNKIKRETRMGYSRQDRINSSKFNWEKDKPPIPGVDDGLPNGLDRNKALGNAIVPQVIYPIMRMIYHIEQALHE